MSVFLQVKMSGFRYSLSETTGVLEDRWIVAGCLNMLFADTASLILRNLRVTSVAAILPSL